jgi:hypothetical protein
MRKGAVSRKTKETGIEVSSSFRFVESRSGAGS